MPDYERYPRPEEPYYEYRHEFLTQGDIFKDVPISQLGPELFRFDEPPKEALPFPENSIPVLSYVWTTGYGFVVSDTCDFRHPKAGDVLARPDEYRDPDSVYHSGFIRVAPIFPMTDCPFLPTDPAVHDRIRQYDHFRRYMYLPPLTRQVPDGVEELMPESVVAFNMTDLGSLDILRRLPKLTQLTTTARQQLNRKLVFSDTGYQVGHREFDPDMD